MGLARQEGRRAKEISRINKIKDFLVGAVSRSCDLDATFGDEIKRVAGLAFPENYFTGLLLEDADLGRDPFNCDRIDALKQTIAVELFDGSGPLRGFHSSENKSARKRRGVGKRRISLVLQAGQNVADMIDNLVWRERFSEESRDSVLHQTIKSIALNETGAKKDRNIWANFAQT